MAKVAINGLGRIGCAAFKIIIDTPELELVAVNDRNPPDNFADSLKKKDIVYGWYEKPVESDSDGVIVDGQKYKVFSEEDPTQLPWGDLGVDIVFECTGVFTRKEDLKKHIQAGAKHVFLSAPTESKDVVTIVHGVNSPSELFQIVSCASCTTNCIAPIAEIMGRRVGVKKAIATTIRGSTLTTPNLVLTSTSATIATPKVLPQYEGKFYGVAVFTPVPVVSIADIIFLTERNTTVEEVNHIFQEESQTERYQNVLAVNSKEDIDSSDITKASHASVVDLRMTQVVDGDLVKIMSWYDTEWGYANQMIREAVRVIQE